MLRELIHDTQKMLKSDFNIHTTGAALETYLKSQGGAQLKRHLIRSESSDKLVTGSVPEYSVDYAPTSSALRMFYSPYEAGLFESIIGYFICKVLREIMIIRPKGTCPSIGISMVKCGDAVKVSFKDATRDKV